MNKLHSYLAIGFFAVFVIQGIAESQGDNNPNDSVLAVNDDSFKQFINVEHEKYEEVPEKNIDEIENLGKDHESFPQEIDRIAECQGEVDPTDSNLVVTGDSFKQFIKAEHKKYAEITEENIDNIKNRGMSTKNFPQKIDRKEIVYFFHAAGFDTEKTLKSIVEHYHYRKELKSIFDKNGKDPRLIELEGTKKVMSISILFNDRYAPGGMQYIYTKMVDKTWYRFNFLKTVRYFFYMIKCLLEEYGTFDGIVVVMNAEGFSLMHAFEFLKSIFLFSPLSRLIHGRLPLRLKKIYVLNANDAVKGAYNKGSETRAEGEESLVEICDQNSSLVYDDVPKEIMPHDGYMNGEGPSYVAQAERTFDLMKKYHVQ